MGKIKFAIIGQGHIGQRHAEMVRRNSEAELVAVCDLLPKEDLGLAGIDEKYYTSIDELLAANNDLDVVTICTPNGLHCEHALLAIDAGKNVVVEKPMALTKTDCETIINSASAKNKTVFCVMQNRYSPPSAWLKKIVEEKIIGDIFIVELNCFWNRDEKYYKHGGWRGTQSLDGGTLFTQFSHFIDIMYWLFGDIKDIQALFKDFNHNKLTEFEDSGLVSFNFESGGMGCINYSTAVWGSNLESSITVIGSKGSVKLGGQYLEKVEYCNIKEYTMPELGPTNSANDYGTYKGSANNHPQVISNVINTLKGKTEITTNALEGLKVVDIIERIYSLRKENRKS